MEYSDHHFRPELARRYGVDAAIFLHNIFYWIKHNRDNEKHCYEGRYWTYNTMAALCATHPYWSRRQLERIIANCKKEGLLLTGCFNQDPRDRTSWYSLSSEALAYFCDDFGVPGQPDPEPEPHPETKPPATEMVDCISPNGEMQISVRGDADHQTVKSFKCTDNRLTDNRQDPPKAPQGGPPAPKPTRRRRAAKSVPEWKPERFEGFWDFYPRHEDRVGAVAEWDKLAPDDALIAVMARALEAQMASEDWQKGIGIPYACRWLRKRRWEDVPFHPHTQGRASPGTGRVVECEEVRPW